jgi:hypothetical protein
MAMAAADRDRRAYCWDRIHFTKASASSGETLGCGGIGT